MASSSRGRPPARLRAWRTQTNSTRPQGIPSLSRAEVRSIHWQWAAWVTAQVLVTRVDGGCCDLFEVQTVRFSQAYCMQGGADTAQFVEGEDAAATPAGTALSHLSEQDAATTGATASTKHPPVDLRFALAPAVGPMLDAPFVPSPKGRIKRLFQLVDLTADDVLADLGCGDGRVLHAGASTVGCRCIGVELDEQLLVKAESDAMSLGVGDKCSWLLQDCSTVELEDATVIVIYMLPSAMGMLTTVMTRHLLQAKRVKRGLKIVTMVFHPDPAALSPAAVDNDWKLQLYDTSSVHES